MADLDLDALEALRAAATQGEWKAARENEYVTNIETADASVIGSTFGDWPDSPRRHAEVAANAALIVAAVNNLPALLSLARTGAARVPSGSDLERAETLAARFADRYLRADATAAIAAELARAREDEREECAKVAAEAWRDLGGPSKPSSDYVARAIRARASQASPAAELCRCGEPRSAHVPTSNGPLTHPRAAGLHDAASPASSGQEVPFQCGCDNQYCTHESHAGDAPAAAQAKKCCPVGATAATCPWRDFVGGAPCECACHRAAAAQEPDRWKSQQAWVRMERERYEALCEAAGAGSAEDREIARAAQEPEQGEARGDCGLRNGMLRLLRDGYGPGGGFYTPFQRIAAAVSLLECGWGKHKPAQAEPDALREALAEVVRLTGVGPPSPPERKRDAGSAWYDLLVRVNAFAKRALAPPATRKGE